MAFTGLVLGACSSDTTDSQAQGAAPVAIVEGAPFTEGDAIGPEPRGTPEIDTSDLPVDARPTTPRGAVEAFLVAQVTGDTTASYALLSSADQGALGESDWALAQTEFPRHVGFEVTAEQELVDGSGTQVAVSANYVSSLDEVAGLIPARANEVWTVVAAGNEWRIDLNRSTSTPVLPSDADAVSAVGAWARTRQECGVPTGEHTSLVGFPSLAEGLCDASGEVRAGSIASLDSLDDVTPYLSAFGSDAASWGRVVTLDDPVGLRVVVAPVDDRWLVVGIAPPSRSG